MENVKIYEIKKSASINYLPLKSVETNSFYWNNAKFIANRVGDYVFFVNRNGQEGLFAKLAETGIHATLITERSEFVHSGRRFSVKGDFKLFVRFDIIETVFLPKSWNWTTPIGQSETYDLWREDKRLDTPDARIEKIEDLRALFKQEATSSILTQCVDLLKSETIKPATTKRSSKSRFTPSLATNDIFPFQTFITISDQQKIGEVVTKDATKFARENKRLYKGLNLKVSFGQAMSTSIPWIAFLGYGQKVQEGFYPVFLYYKEHKLLILSFGVSETRDPSSNWTIPAPLITIDSHFSSKGLNKPDRYGNSYFYKEYPTTNQINESDLMTDLDNVISIYNREFEYKERNVAEATQRTDEKETYKNQMSQTTVLIDFNDELRQLLMAIKTKPFVLLAGISGIGKSRLARTLAYKTCALELLQEEQNPGNFLLIQVKPNWYDSTELLGYESNITGSSVYKPTAFVKFIIKAHLYPDIPFIVCLDEMNLAPVEQYLAEYLSAIESRRYENGFQITDALVQSAIFKKANRTSELWADLNIENNKSIQATLMQKGLIIPRNLVVIGTVNMDETTHSFSKKVLDRAMTIEINKVDLRHGLKNSSVAWKYPHEFYDHQLVFGEAKSASELYKSFDERDDLLTCLTEINDILDKTPFKFAYRVRDEALAYCHHHASLFKSKANWFPVTLDEIISMKILSRIEGDEAKCKKVLERLESLLSQREMQGSLDKVKEMADRLKSGYTSYFS